MDRPHICIPLIVCFCLAGCSSAPADVSEPAIVSGPAQCLQTSRIRGFEIVDKGHFLYTLTNGDLYLNNLAEECPGIGRLDQVYVANKTTTSLRLLNTCSGDRIATENRLTRFQSSCRLGEFVPISREEAEQLLAESLEENP